MNYYFLSAKLYNKSNDHIGNAYRVGEFKDAIEAHNELIKVISNATGFAEDRISVIAFNKV